MDLRIRRIAEVLHHGFAGRIETLDDRPDDLVDVETAAAAARLARQAVIGRNH
jgi:hypothetical protein